MVTVFLADGFEEIEACTPIDILRRGGVEVCVCSISDSLKVTGAHGIVFYADTTLSRQQGEEDMILLPGGMPGTLRLKESEALKERILRHREKGGLFAAICAAPTVLGAHGILQGRRATCYPGMESELNCLQAVDAPVMVSEDCITSRGAGTAFLFSLRILERLKGKEAALSLARSMCFEEDLG